MAEWHEAGGVRLFRRRHLAVVCATPGARRPAQGTGIPARHPAAVEDYFRYCQATHDIDYVLLALANVYGPRQDAQGEVWWRSSPAPCPGASAHHLRGR